MAKIITKKSDIPKYAQKAIKNFKKLTKNQAIYEYELLKLKRRAGRELGSYLTGYYKPQGKITQKAIKAISSIKGKKLEAERAVYEQEKRAYETERRFEREDRGFVDYTFDLNDEIGKEISYEPTEKTYSSFDEYLVDTDQTIDPTTGEVVSVADAEELARNFFDRLIEEIEMMKDQAEVSYSSYKSGRTRSVRSRQWVADNITRGADRLINLIESRRSDPQSEIAFYKSLSGTSLSELQDAISEYMANLYYQSAESLNGYMQSSRIYQLLSQSPVGMDELEEFDEE